jgi:propanediol dehydratase small subunit
VNQFTGILLALAVSAGGVLLADRIRFRHFWDRGCMGRAWLSAFPDASKAEIRDFLTLFGEAFLSGAKRRLSFGPADRLIEIYRTRYPAAWPDAMELEAFERRLGKKYGFNLRSELNEGLTLGEIFAKTRAA